MQYSLKSERGRCGKVGRTVDVTDYLEDNGFVFEMRLGPEYMIFTFCVADINVSHAISSVQVVPTCTLVHIIILRGDQYMTYKESGLWQQNLDGLVIKMLAPKRLISISTGFLHPQGDLLAD